MPLLRFIVCKTDVVGTVHGQNACVLTVFIIEAEAKRCVGVQGKQLRIIALFVYSRNRDTVALHIGAFFNRRHLIERARLSACFRYVLYRTCPISAVAVTYVSYARLIRAYRCPRPSLFRRLVRRFRRLVRRFRISLRSDDTEVTDINGKRIITRNTPNIKHSQLRIVKQSIKRNKVTIRHFAFPQNVATVATRKPSIRFHLLTIRVCEFTLRLHIEVKDYKIALTSQRRIVIHTLFGGEIQFITNRAFQLEEGGYRPRVARRDCCVIYHTCLRTTPATVRSTYRSHVRHAVPNHRRDILITRQRR